MKAETINDLERSSVVAVAIAVFLAMLGSVLISYGALALGGVALWASGFNASRAARSWRKH